MRRLVLTIAATAIPVSILVGVTVAAGSSFTLRIRRDVHVTNAPNAAFSAKPVNKHEAVAVGAAGFAVYTFQGETSRHFICHKTANPNTNCWAFWPPVAVASPTGLRKQTGIRGHLGTVDRGGVLQLTLSGQPLYYFQPDLQSHNKHKATGDELNTFGSIWHIVVSRKAATARQNVPNAPAPTSTGTSNGGSGGYGSGW